jgi:hypothetical protein
MKPSKKAPRVRGKVNVRQSRAKLLDLGQKYVSGQASGDPQNTLKPQAQAVATTRSSLMALLDKRVDLNASLATNSKDIEASRVQYNGALFGYAGAAATFAGGDASVLASVGVDAAATPTKPEQETVGTPVLTISKGEHDGDALLRCKRVPYAGSYVFQYKLEPSLPTDPWLGDISTKLASTPLSGLAPAQLLRARARAIGVVAGPWSAEVVGRAK